MATDTTSRRTELLLGLGEIGFAGVLVVLAAGVGLTAIMRLFDPMHWGLWVSPRMFLFGVIDDPSEAREVLGWKIYVVAPLFVFLAFMAVKESWVSGRFRVAKAWLVSRR